MKLLDCSPLIFQERAVPPGTVLAGMAALVHGLEILAPVRRPAAISTKHVKGNIRREGAWHVFDKRYGPGDSVEDHLTFALRHEDLDLLVLKRIFLALPEAVLEAFVRSALTGTTNRRAWFLYEFLTGRTLDVPEPPKVTAVELLDSTRYFTLPGVLSRRHRVRNNLLGPSGFCPMIRRTEILQSCSAQDLPAKTQETIGRVSRQLVARAASFLLLADSRASFAIEGERPPRNRLERWARAVLQAGKQPLSLEEVERLHRILIEDTRFVSPGLRLDGVFLGERAADGEPLPEFIGARPEDLASLMASLLEANALMQASNMDPVLQATALAFGFVYIHPFQDGNGRLHRYLIHHVLAERRFSPPGLVFPVSSVMLDRIDDYRTTLQSHTAPLMPCIDWHPTARGNVKVTNETSDLYRYPDCTAAAEFLYGCVKRTVEFDLPRELDYLRRHDQAMGRLMDLVEMPDRLTEDFIMFVRQNGGTLAKRRRQHEFAKLTDPEVAAMETVVREAFEGFE